MNATRDDEPQGILGIFANKKPTPAKLVEDALAGFQKAQDAMIAAQDAIKAQQAEHTTKAIELQAKAAECQSQHERLARVSNRLTDLLA